MITNPEKVFKKPKAPKAIKPRRPSPQILRVISTKGIHSWVEAQTKKGLITIRKQNVNIPAGMLQ